LFLNLLLSDGHKTVQRRYTLQPTLQGGTVISGETPDAAAWSSQQMRLESWVSLKTKQICLIKILSDGTNNNTAAVIPLVAHLQLSQ